MTPRQSHIIALLREGPKTMQQIRAARARDSGVSIASALCSLATDGLVRLRRSEAEENPVYTYHLSRRGNGQAPTNFNKMRKPR